MIVTNSDIIKMWVILRESVKAQSIPSDALDFVKNVSIEALEKLEKYGDGLSLEDIINYNGWYVADGFRRGTCIEVYKGEAKILSYDCEDSVLPTREPLTVYAALFNKRFKKVYNKKELF